MLRNKRGDIESVFYLVIVLVVFGIVFLFVNHLNNEIFTNLNSNLGKNSTANYSYASDTLQEIQAKDNRLWDYAFLGLFMGVLIVVGLSAYAIRISPVFYWVYGFISLFVLGLGVILSNAWQSIASSPTFATTITRFPITNFLLGSYYPLVVVVIIILSMVIMFGKPTGQQEGFI